MLEVAEIGYSAIQKTTIEQNVLDTYAAKKLS